jgi:hypothetical protein
MIGKQKLFLLLIIFTMFSPAGRAGDSLSVSQVVKIELSGNMLRMPQKGYFDKYLADKEYNYGQDFNNPKGNNFIHRLGRFIFSILKLVFETFNTLHVVLKIAFIVFCIFLLCFLIIRTKIYKLFYTDKEVLSYRFTEIDTNDNLPDFEKAINIQLSQQNFRNAIRLLYRKILKELEIHELIRYSREKTNREYAKEIANNSLRSGFYQLSGIYNRIWYGNYPLSKEEYESLAQNFYQFSEGINAEEK